MLHLTILGIEINNDGGVLFMTALITRTLSLIVLYLYRKDITFVGQKLNPYIFLNSLLF